MKLEKNNKYNKCKSLGLAVIVASGIILSGCNNVKSEVPLPTPTEVVEVTPTPTIKPTATPRPTATPKPKLSDDELIELFGIKEPDKIEKLANVNVFEYTINGQRKIMFALINAIPNENGGHDVYEWFTGKSEVMFSLDYDIFAPGKSDAENYDCKNITIVNQSLNGAIIDKGYTIGCLSRKLKGNDIHLDKTSEYYNLLNVSTEKEAERFLNTLMTNKEIAYIYLWAVPAGRMQMAADLDQNNLVEEDKVLVK